MVIKISTSTQTTPMTYFNYHAKAKRLISSNHCISVSIFENYRNIKPAMVLYFDNNIPIPIREYMWKEYFPLIKHFKITINNPNGIDLSQFSSVN